MCSFVPAGSDEPLEPSVIFSSGSAEPAGHEPTLLGSISKSSNYKSSMMHLYTSAAKAWQRNC
jgi:hypothetical protein